MELSPQGSLNFNPDSNSTLSENAPSGSKGSLSSNPNPHYFCQPHQWCTQSDAMVWSAIQSNQVNLYVQIQITIHPLSTDGAIVI